LVHRFSKLHVYHCTKLLPDSWWPGDLPQWLKCVQTKPQGRCFRERSRHELCISNVSSAPLGKSMQRSRVLAFPWNSLILLHSLCLYAALETSSRLIIKDLKSLLVGREYTKFRIWPSTRAWSASGETIGWVREYKNCILLPSIFRLLFPFFSSVAGGNSAYLITQSVYSG
jgi:hypothetical protein